MLQNRKDVMARAVEYDISHKCFGANVKRYMEMYALHKQERLGKINLEWKCKSNVGKTDGL